MPDGGNGASRGMSTSAPGVPSEVGWGLWAGTTAVEGVARLDERMTVIDVGRYATPVLGAALALKALAPDSGPGQMLAAAVVGAGSEADDVAVGALGATVGGAGGEAIEPLGGGFPGAVAGGAIATKLYDGSRADTLAGGVIAAAVSFVAKAVGPSRATSPATAPSPDRTAQR